MPNKRRVLFLCPEFFNYEKVMATALNKKFGQVDYVNLRSSNSYLKRNLFRYNKSISKKIIKCLKDNSYDAILIVKGENISETLIEKIALLHKKNVYLYNWDSIKNFDNTHLFKYCTKVFSFDPVDCKVFNLFYKEMFLSKFIDQDQKYFKNKLMFIGTARNDRITILSQILSQPKSDLTYVVNLYFQSFFIYIVRVILNPSLIKIPNKFIYFKKISYASYLDKLKEVSYVLDIESNRQSGLTPRSIEALCNGKILITTNPYALHSPLNTGENVHVIKRTDKDPLSKIAFDKRLKRKVLEKIIKTYHVDFWVNEFFE